MKRNDGFTLIELVISIAIGSLITAAALSTLLFGLRINAQTANNAKQQNATNMLVQILQNVAESKELDVSEDALSILSDENTIVVFDGERILLNGSEFMTDVDNFKATMSDDNRLLTIELNNGKYVASVYCRLNIPNENNIETLTLEVPTNGSES